MSSGANRFLPADTARRIIAGELDGHANQELLIAFMVLGKYGTARTIWLDRTQARILFGLDVQPIVMPLIREQVAP